MWLKICKKTSGRLRQVVNSNATTPNTQSVEEFPTDILLRLSSFLIYAKNLTWSRPYRTGTEHLLIEFRHQTSTAYATLESLQNCKTDFWFFARSRVGGVFFRKRRPPPISGTGWDVKPKFLGYVGTLSMQFPVEGILLPVTTSGSTDNRIFDGGKTGEPFPGPPAGPLERDRHPRMRKIICQAVCYTVSTSVEGFGRQRAECKGSFFKNRS